jgi:hypothetical protein
MQRCGANGRTSRSQQTSLHDLRWQTDIRPVGVKHPQVPTADIQTSQREPGATCAQNRISHRYNNGWRFRVFFVPGGGGWLRIETKPTPPPAICAMRSRSLLTLNVRGSYDNTYSQIVLSNPWLFPRYVPKDKSNLSLPPPELTSHHWLRVLFVCTTYPGKMST